MKEVPFWMFGLGGVGATLLRILQDEETASRLQANTGMALRPILLADSTGYVADIAGLSDTTINLILDCKASGEPLGSIGGSHPATAPLDVFRALHTMRDMAGTIGVDTTASDQMIPVWRGALDAGAGVVLANKKPLSAGLDDFLALTHTRRCRHEATVGAGLPIISTLRSLLDSGDRVTAIQGCFSGTLGYICSALNGGKPYSTAVMEAVEAGYAEPDPRDDLCGVDVARKALILSRIMGRTLELNDLAVEPMIPQALDGLGLDEFTRRLPEADVEMKERVRSAGQRGKALSYVADLSSDAPTIGLREVDQDSPIGRLRGTDNIAVFHTARYDETPLVIQGPGAGRAVTAGGVLSDMILLAREV